MPPAVKASATRYCWPATAVRTRAARPPMGMALVPPSGTAAAGTANYGSGCVHWIYSIERAVNLHTSSFANSVCHEVFKCLAWQILFYTALTALRVSAV